MDKCEFNCFEDIMKACGYSFDEDGNIQFCNPDNENFEYGIGCGDISGGFQYVYPELFIVIGEVIGAIVSQRLPINVQNAFGNWLQLVGQAILTYNAQQQYYQGGPGHYFDPRNYDIANSYDKEYCSNNNDDYEYKRDGEYKEDGRTNFGINRKTSRSKGDIKDIEKEVRYLKKQIHEMQSEINNIKNNG